MKRSVDILISNNRFVSNTASCAFVLLICALIIVAIEAATGSTDIRVSGVLSITIGTILLIHMICALVTMVAVTWIVLVRRREIVDWGMFLAITWLIPYIGVTTYLGGSNLLRRHIRVSDERN